MFRLACKKLCEPTFFLMVPILELEAKGSVCVCVFKARHEEFVERFAFSLAVSLDAVCSAVQQNNTLLHK